jgi:hypothetical protein
MTGYSSDQLAGNSSADLRFLRSRSEVKPMVFPPNSIYKDDVCHFYSKPHAEALACENRRNDDITLLIGCSKVHVCYDVEFTIISFLKMQLRSNN